MIDPINEIQRINPAITVPMVSAKPKAGSSEISFEDILSRKLSGRVSFSKHAAARLDSRDMRLTDSQLERVEHGVANAALKGIRDSLVMVDGICLIVNTGSGTVITAVSAGSYSIFTNIDGAVVV